MRRPVASSVGSYRPSPSASSQSLPAIDPVVFGALPPPGTTKFAVAVFRFVSDAVVAAVTALTPPPVTSRTVYEPVGTSRTLNWSVYCPVAASVVVDGSDPSCRPSPSVST